MKKKLETKWLDWMEQALINSLDWHKANTPNASAKSLSDYTAGFRYGYLQAISDLKMHGGDISE